MKSRNFILAITVAAATALTIPAKLAAQDQQGHRDQVRYTVTDLGTLGGTFSEAVGINNRGAVSGNSTLTGDSFVHGFFWRNGGMTDLGTLGGPNSFAPEEWAPNAEDEVAGFSDTSTFDPNNENFCGPFSFLSSDPYICRPFVWRQGVKTPLPTLGGDNAAAVAINNRGQLVGVSETGTATDCVPHYDAVVWGTKIGEIHELPPLPGDTEAITAGINDDGEVVGSSGNCERGPIEAVVWRHGTPVNLGTLGGTVFNIAFGINNRGQVVGQSNLVGDRTHHAFLWQNGVMTDLGTIHGLPNSLATSINNRGQVVGFSQDANGDISSTVAWIWQDGVMTDLNTLIPGDSPYFLIEALSINDRGQIAGFMFDSSAGIAPGFVATPVESSERSAPDTNNKETARQLTALPEDIRQLLEYRARFGRGLWGTPRNSTLNATTTTSLPVVSLLPTSLTFSTQPIGTTTVAKTVTLKNTGTATLSISGIGITGANAPDFSQTHTCGTSLAAGASCSISVKFKPPASGTRTAVLSISDNAAGSPQKVTLSGIGTTAMLSPTSLNFGSVGLGARLAKTVTLKNVGTTTLTISGIVISGTNAGDFAQTHTCGSSLSKGVSCTISVTFKPTATGTGTAALSVSDNAAGSPQKVALSGIGVSGGTLTGYCLSFIGPLECRITSDPTQCPPGKPAINPVDVVCGRGGIFWIDGATSCRGPYTRGYCLFNPSH